MNSDLFFAILSMDSYNRGYRPGVGQLDEAGIIGKATLLAANEAQKAGWEAAGFYAIAYEWQGEIIIAYRGSDDERLKDITLGYPTALGFSSLQGILSIRFARAVIGAENLPTSVENVTVTGHSLGAGLAGYVGNLYGWTNVLFDPIPYTGTVLSTYGANFTGQLDYTVNGTRGAGRYVS